MAFTHFVSIYNSNMTIKQSILKLLSDHKERHYMVIAKKLNKNPMSVVVILKNLKQEGLLQSPTITIVKTKRGFYQMKKYDEPGKCDICDNQGTILK